MISTLEYADKINITEMIMNSRTSTPMEPMIIDSLLDPRKTVDLA